MSKNSKDENEGKSQRVMKKEKQRRHSDRQYNLTVKGTEKIIKITQFLNFSVNLFMQLKNLRQFTFLIMYSTVSQCAEKYYKK